MKYSVIFALFLCTAGLWAQNATEEIFRQPLEPATMDAFKTVCSRLASHSVVQGNFEQEKTLSRLNRTLKSSGNFTIAAGLGMIWDTVKPFPSTLILGKDYLIQYRPGGQKTVLNAQGNETFLRMAEVINAVFSGDSQGLIDNFNIYYSGSAGARWELGLSPKDSAIGTFAEKIIMKGGGTPNGATAIMSILIYEKNGDAVLYNLSNHIYPAEMNVNEKKLFSSF